MKKAAPVWGGLFLFVLVFYFFEFPVSAFAALDAFKTKTFWRPVFIHHQGIDVCKERMDIADIAVSEKSGILSCGINGFHSRNDRYSEFAASGSRGFMDYA